MLSQKAEELAVIIRSYLVRYFAESGNPCQPSGIESACKAFPDGCLKCAEARGNELGRQIEEAVVRELGGVRLTIPTLKGIETREKHRQIKKEFNGANHERLAHEFGYSRKQIYNIVAKEG